MILPFLVPAAAAAALAYLLSPLVARLAEAVGAMDRPGARKLHTTPIPRLGGLSVLVAVGVVWFAQSLVFEQWSLPREIAIGLGLGLLPIVVISLIDDIRSVRPAMKLLAHVGGAVFAVSWGISLGADVHLFGATIPLGWVAAPLSVIWIVGVTNAFNLIDGLDGLSSGLALIAACSLAAVFLLVGQPAMVAATLVLAGALAGFLPYNLHPARMFLGDTGSAAVGFSLAALALKGGSTLSSGFAVLIPVFILGLPITDTLVAVVRRGLRRLEHHRGGLFVADRNHIHHRLLALGVDHKKAVLILSGTGLLCTSAAFASLLLSVREAALFTAALLLAGLVGIHRLGYREFAFIRRGVFLKVLDAPVVNRSMFAVFADVAVVLVAAYIAVSLKTDSWSLTVSGSLAMALASLFAPLTVLLFWLSGLYRGSWRFTGIHDFARGSAVAALVAPLGLIGHAVLALNRFPVSLFLIYGVVSLVLVMASRAAYAVLVDLQQHASMQGVSALLYGAGERGVASAQQLYRDHTIGLRPIGFVDDDPTKLGTRVSGLPIVGSIRDLEHTLNRQGAKAILITTSHLRPDRLERVSKICRRTGAGLFRARPPVERITDTPGLLAVDSRPAPWLSTPMEPSLPEYQSADAGPELDAGSTPPTLAYSNLRCPAYNSSKVYRSRSKGPEWIRKFLTEKRPYRCRQCDWRGWIDEINGFELVLPGQSALEPPNLRVIDQLLRPHRTVQRPLASSHPSAPRGVVSTVPPQGSWTVV